MKLEEIVALTFERFKNDEIKRMVKEKRIEKEPKKENILKAQRILEECEKKKIKILTFMDKEYPVEFTIPYYPPLVLYYRGQPSVLKKRRKIAIIGTRKPTKYGRDVAYIFSKKLSLNGVVIVSGGARGIDTMAHKGAIDGTGETVCILGSGIDVPYPPENKRVFRQIEEKGILISEYPPGTKPFAYHFPMRNRLIASLSEGVVVVEAGEKSGTFITVKWALDIGRDIFAIPGDIFSKKSKGPNFLIREGARLISTPEELLYDMGIEILKEEKKEIELKGIEKEIYEFLKEKGRKSVDEIKSYVNKNTGEVLSALLNLEIKGIVRNEGFGIYSLK